MRKKRFNPINLFFINKCALCRKPSEDALCPSCIKSVVPLGFGCCEKCGKPFKNCVCKNIKANFKSCISAFRYEQPAVSALIYKLKSKGNRKVAQFLSDAMIKRIDEEYRNINFDFITFVPTSKSKLKRKGFDHAELLAAKLSGHLNTPCIPPPFKRAASRAQKYLSKTSRQQNAASAFCLKHKTVSGRVLIVDDVMTTGATLSACTELLKKAGADEVYCITAATSAGR